MTRPPSAPRIPFPCAALGLVLCAAAPHPASALCSTPLVDSRSLHILDGHPVVTVSVDGEPVSMLLDTGAETSSVTHATASRFQLPVDPRRRANVTGIDGTRTRDVVRVTLTVAGPGRGLDLPVLDLPGPFEGIAGVLGRDVMSAYDLDLDEPGQAVAFRRPSGCPATEAPWPGPSLHASFGSTGAVLLPVGIGPVTVSALLDTGNPGAVLGHAAAVRAGLTDDRLANGAALTVMGASLSPVTMRVAELQDVRIGPDRLPFLAVAVAPFELPGTDMLLGNDYAGRRRLLISWARRMVFVKAQ